MKTKERGKENEEKGKKKEIWRNFNEKSEKTQN